jgi:hypothetical protein
LARTGGGVTDEVVTGGAGEKLRWRRGERQRKRGGSRKEGSKSDFFPLSYISERDRLTRLDLSRSDKVALFFCGQDMRRWNSKIFIIILEF